MVNTFLVALFLFSTVSSNDCSRSLSFTMTKRLSENQRRRKSYPILSLGGLYRNREQNATDEIHVDTKKFMRSSTNKQNDKFIK